MCSLPGSVRNMTSALVAWTETRPTGAAAVGCSAARSSPSAHRSSGPQLNNAGNLPIAFRRHKIWQIDCGVSRSLRAPVQIIWWAPLYCHLIKLIIYIY